MNFFSYTRAGSLQAAIAGLQSEAAAKIIAGGTNLTDLMKENVERPARLVDITRLPMTQIQNTEAGGLRLGALVTNADTAWNDQVEQRYPLISKAILAGASPQIRNMATDGGNLLQRTRCYYFYDSQLPCNKRMPGTGCSAIDGFNRMHAILGASEHCIATHPSDFCVALAALDAVVCVEGTGGERLIPFGEFHRLPGDTPQLDTNLRHDEVITAIELPSRGFAQHHAYLKLRDRHSYAFALVSVAVGLEMDGAKIREARVALGGVAHKPWRNTEAEKALAGQAVSASAFRDCARQILAGAKGYRHNAFKIELAERAIVRALADAAGVESDI